MEFNNEKNPITLNRIDPIQIASQTAHQNTVDEEVNSSPFLLTENAEKSTMLSFMRHFENFNQISLHEKYITKMQLIHLSTIIEVFRLKTTLIHRNEFREKRK